MKFSLRIIYIISLLTLISTLSGCGGGGNGGSSGGQETESAAPSATAANNGYSLTQDTYGMQDATYLAATNNNGLFVIRAAIAGSMTDPNFRTIFRIDIMQPQNITAGSSIELGGVSSPVEIIFFNGQRSTLLNTVSGTITFTSYGTSSQSVVSGHFSAVVEDQSYSAPRPTYHIDGDFSFVVNTYGPRLPTPPPVPVAANGYYDLKCGSCHSLGNHDTTSVNGAPDLAGKGGELPGHFTGYEPGHVVVPLAEEELYDLKVLLNAS